MILSIDPGMTTGAVLLDRSLPGDGVLFYSAVEIYDYKAGFLPAIMGTPDLRGIVIERPPPFPDSRELPYLFGILERAAREQALQRGLPFVTPLPGQWKPVAKGMKWNVPHEFRSQHLKDAFLMGRFAISRYEQDFYPQVLS